jgi:hypothetical protein
MLEVEVQIDLSIVLCMRSSFLVESFDLLPSNQHLLVPFCENVFVPGKVSSQDVDQDT